MLRSIDGGPKWFYDTSIGVAIEAVRCDSFVGNDFSLLIISY
jgi:hypothetical protein